MCEEPEKTVNMEKIIQNKRKRERNSVSLETTRNVKRKTVGMKSRLEGNEVSTVHSDPKKISADPDEHSESRKKRKRSEESGNFRKKKKQSVSFHET